MKILFTNHRLQHRGGTELFVREMAQRLAALGHEICVFSTVGGEIAESIAAGGIPVVTDPRQCTFRPDIIHGQHHLETMTALTLWPDVPAVYFAHGQDAWEERRPRHPRIKKYIATCPRLAFWVAREAGLPVEEVAIVKNYFDDRVFREVRNPGIATGQALVYLNSMAKDSPAHRALQAACAATGLELHARGTGFGQVVEEPGNFLPRFDVVFAGGRSAIEAMACGCCVIPITKDNFHERIHPTNFSEMSDLNFCADRNDPLLEASAIAGELRRISPTETATVTSMIRASAGMDDAAATLLATYGNAIAAMTATPASNVSAEAQAAGEYLLWLAAAVKDMDERRAAWMQMKNDATDRSEKWKMKSDHLSSKVNWLQQQMETGNWFLRRAWRRLRDKWEKR